MSAITISARQFARDLAKAKRAAAAGPVFVTDRGKPTFALLKIEDYYKLTGEPARTLLDVMDSLPGADVEFQLSQLNDIELRPAELE